VFLLSGLAVLAYLFQAVGSCSLLPLWDPIQQF